MAINWDKEYGTSEPKKSKINWEKEYNPTGFKERIDTEKADLRSKGLPVSVRDDRSAPTKGGSILRDILKVPATLLARPGQALGAIQGLTPEEQTVKSKYLGDIKTVQTGKDVLSDVGRGLELASYGVGIGAGKNILAQSGKQAAKQIAKRTALEGAIGGFTGSAGRVITNQSGNLKQDLKDIALGTGIGTIAGGALGYAGGRLGGKLLSAEERAMERAVGKGGKFNIPEVGTPEIKTKSQLEEIWKKANQATPNTPETKIPTVKTTKITENKVSEKEIEYLRNTLPKDEALKVDSITLKDIKEKSIKFIEDNGIEKSKRIALGIEPEPYKYGSQGIHAELSNYAARTGDGELLSELAQVDISKEAAQRTGLGRIREPDNPFYIIKDINNELNKKQNIVNKMNQKFEMNNIIDKLKNKLSNIAELSEEQVVKIARKLVCK